MQVAVDECNRRRAKRAGIDIESTVGRLLTEEELDELRYMRLISWITHCGSEQYLTRVSCINYVLAIFKVRKPFGQIF
jgi:hypothetical protein